jgi:hypothetical protein
LRAGTKVWVAIGLRLGSGLGFWVLWVVAMGSGFLVLGFLVLGCWVLGSAVWVSGFQILGSGF